MTVALCHASANLHGHVPLERQVRAQRIGSKRVASSMLGAALTRYFSGDSIPSVPNRVIIAVGHRQEAALHP
jgi:hypothetical protein